MPHIRINTELTREISQQLAAEGERLAEIGHDLQNAVDSLDTRAWDGRSRWRAEPMLNHVRPESDGLAQRIEDLGRQLIRITDAFEQADTQSAAGVAAIP